MAIHRYSLEFAILRCLQIMLFCISYMLARDLLDVQGWKDDREASGGSSSNKFKTWSIWVLGGRQHWRDASSGLGGAEAGWSGAGRSQQVRPKREPRMLE